MGLQSLLLHSDPPDWVAHDPGTFIDEGLKTLRARNLILFGRPTALSEDAYFGGSGGPVATLLQLTSFAAFGPSSTSARLVSILAGIGLLAALAPLSPIRLAAAALAPLAFDPFFFSFSRLALPEVLWCTFASGALAAALRDRLVTAALLLGFAALSKGTALLAAPAVLVAGWSTIRRTPRRRANGRVVAAAVLLVAAATAWVLTRPVEPGSTLGSALTSAFSHFLEVPDAAGNGLFQLLRANPILYVLAVTGLALAWTTRRSEQERWLTRAALVWLAAGLVATILAGFSIPPPRYLVNLTIPLWLFATIALARLATWWGARAHPIMLIIACLSAGWSVFGPGSPSVHDRSLADARNAFRALSESRDHPLVSGLWGASLAINSGAPVLVTCAGCRFPPGGTSQNLEWLVAGLEERRESQRMLIVTSEELGETRVWRNVLSRLGAPFEETMRMTVSGHSLVVFEVHREEPRVDPS